MNLPETDEEITEFIRAVDAGEIECPPAPNAKLLARLCVQQTQIEKLEAESQRLHDLWHAAEVKVNHAKISDHERRVIDRLAVAWNEFNALQIVEDEAKAEFRHAINTAASIIALRVARRVNPECWTPSSADAEILGQNAERIHGGAGQPNQPETPTPLDGASC